MITSHVTSLPVSKRLAPHLPVGWESEHYWVKLKKGIPPKGFSLSDWFLYPQKTTEMLRTKYPDHIEHISAPLLSEMVELLPDVIKENGAYFYRMLLYGDIRFHDLKTNTKLKHFNFKCVHNMYSKINAATAAAELFLWVKENGHIKEGA